ncbi:MAG: hypothetical protein ACT4QF_13945 [Sporichthyaceae bacterium]|jgi:hypothetical protein
MRLRAGTALVATCFAVTGCGSGGSDKKATMACEGASCTVTYPAKARNNQSSSGGPPAEVFGEQTQLFGIAGGQATFRIANEEVRLTAGAKREVGPFTVQALEVTDTSVVLKYTKA